MSGCLLELRTQIDVAEELKSTSSRRVNVANNERGGHFFPIQRSEDNCALKHRQIVTKERMLLRLQ